MPCSSASGRGGQPGTYTSTGMIWSTPLVTEYESQYGPPQLEQAPKEITYFGSGICSYSRCTAGAILSVTDRYGVLLRTRVPREDPRLATLTAVYPGANWPERETWEMFGIAFDGHPNLVKLLLPDQFEGHPLRKDFVLASRVAKVWPGAKEPGESGSGAPSRRRMRPPGVPDDWGPG